MPVYANKDACIEACWQKMIEVGAHHGLYAFVCHKTLANVPPEEADVDAYTRMLDKIIECAWREGFRSALTALELGAINTFMPDHGKN